ncbi:MAG: hypothetical protein LBE44_00140 [Microbacterium hominis]|jgi:hypothetical protein|nr:hypothetical protein [Microbacterium hominis]
MNVEFGGEQHESAIAKVLKATKAAGKFASIFVRWVSDILNDMISATIDLVMLDSA